MAYFGFSILFRFYFGFIWLLLAFICALLRFYLSAYLFISSNRVNKESVAFLETKHSALQDEIQNWINKYDHDIEEKEREIETLKLNKANDLVK